MSDHDWDRANHDQTKSPDHSRKLPISINVYDLMPQSRLSSFMWFTGVSICHSGVVISEEEWAFGGHDVDGVSGVYVTKPRAVPDNAIFRASIAIGFTTLSNKEIRHELDRLRSEYTGPSYDLLKKNCNHFVEEVCLALCGVSPPAWINRIAGIGAKLPVCVSEVWVNPPQAELEEGEDSALLLPPSERNPMQRSSYDFSHAGAENPSNYDDDDSRNDAYLSRASGGKRLHVGSI